MSSFERFGCKLRPRNLPTCVIQTEQFSDHSKPFLSHVIFTSFHTSWPPWNVFSMSYFLRIRFRCMIPDPSVLISVRGNLLSNSSPVISGFSPVYRSVCESFPICKCESFSPYLAVCLSVCLSICLSVLPSWCQPTRVFSYFQLEFSFCSVCTVTTRKRKRSEGG